MNTYKSFLASQNLKNTAPRKKLFGIVEQKKGHFGIEDIQKSAQEIGIATLYRFLRSMVDAGYLKEHHFGEKTLFESTEKKDHHDHIICEKCGIIKEFYSPEIEELQESILKEKGFIPTHHRHELYGLCKKCQ